MENYSILEGPQLGLSGTIQSWEVVNSDGSIARACYEPHSNLITDIGLGALNRENVGTYDRYQWKMITYIALGTGTAEPSATDSRLGTEVFRGFRPYTAYNGDTISPAGGVGGHFYVSRATGYQTNVGDLNHTITEVGFTYSSTFNAATMCSKHRLKDEYGNPTSVTVRSDQQLRLKYILSIEVTPITTYTGSFQLSGYTISGAPAETINYEAGWQDCTTFDTVAMIPRYGHVQLGIHNVQKAFTPIGTSITKTGIVATNLTAEDFGYVDANTAYMIKDFLIDTSVGTWADGIQFIQISGNGGTGLPWFMNISPPIIKPDTHTMTLRMKFSWGRAT